RSESMVALPTSLFITSLLCFFTHTAPPALYTLSLHDALPISLGGSAPLGRSAPRDPSYFPLTCRPARTSSAYVAIASSATRATRSEEHTSELQSRGHLVCRLLLEKKKTIKQTTHRLHFYSIKL